MTSSGDDGLPFPQYTSAAAVHVTLLAFTALFLPRAALLWEPTTHSSTDKPQHEFLDALTASPISTVAWMCLGVAFIQVWWGGWVRSWYIASVLRSESSAGGRDGDETMRRVKLQQKQFKVIFFYTVREVRVLTVRLAFERGISGDTGRVRRFSRRTCPPRCTSDKLFNPISHRARLSF